MDSSSTRPPLGPPTESLDIPLHGPRPAPVDHTNTNSEEASTTSNAAIMDSGSILDETVLEPSMSPDQTAMETSIHPDEPVQGSPAPTIPDYDAKMAIIRDMYTIMRDGTNVSQFLSHLDVAVMMHLELSDLEKVRREQLSPPRSPEDISESILEIMCDTMDKQNLVRYFLLCGPTSVIDRPPQLQQGPARCIVSGAPDPVASQIIPPRWVSSQAYRHKTFDRLCLGSSLPLDSPDHHPLRNLIISRDTSGSIALDQAWNLVPLSERMHEWWRKAYWAFEVLGHEAEGTEQTEETQTADAMDAPQTTVRLAFHWMKVPAPGCVTMSKFEAVMEGKEGLDPVCNDLELRHPVVHHHDTGRLITTGDVCTVSIAREDAPSFLRAMRLQWDLISIAATAGAAQRPELLYELEDFENAQKRWDELMHPGYD